jgi:hypothetical protein
MQHFYLDLYSGFFLFKTAIGPLCYLIVFLVVLYCLFEDKHFMICLPSGLPKAMQLSICHLKF